MAAKHEQMQSITDNKVVCWTSPLIPEVTVGITAMFLKLKGTLENTIKRYQARRVVRGSLDIPDVQHDPLAGDAPVASGP